MKTALLVVILVAFPARASAECAWVLSRVKRAMKRLSAIIAFVLTASPAWAGGWYLLEPHQTGVEETIRRYPHLRDEWQIATATLSLDAPLGRWDHILSFDTAKECEDKRRERAGGSGGWSIGQFFSTSNRNKRLVPWDLVLVKPGVSDEIKKKYPKLEQHLEYLQPSKALCIATDDPRLKDTVDPRGPKGK